LRGVAHVDLQPLITRADRQPLIAELADDVERLARRLLQREPQLVRRHSALDLHADMRRRLEEPVGRHQPIERLMGALKVVVADEVLEPLLRVDDVREHRPAEKLVPQRLPESLDLAERLRMLWPAADVLDAHPLQRLLELRLPAPHRVLSAVVGQHLRRLAIRRDAALQCLHHERRLLVMCERVSDDEPAVVVHEHAGVEPLRAPQPEREDVRLPQLIRCRALEAARPVLARGLRHRRLDESLVVQDPPHLLLGDAHRLEPREHVADAPRPPVPVLLFQCHDVVALHRVGLPARPVRGAASRLECGRTALPERAQPLPDRGTRHAERLGGVGLAGAS
jgi:hypothetical protein